MEQNPVEEAGLGCEENVAILSSGLMDIYKEPLSDVAASLSELTSKQRSLIEAVTLQNQRLQNSQNSDAVKLLFSDISVCRERLVNIKKQMTSLHDRTSKLKARSLSVGAQASLRHSGRLQELHREQRLIPHRATTALNPNSYPQPSQQGIATKFVE